MIFMYGPFFWICIDATNCLFVFCSVNLHIGMGSSMEGRVESWETLLDDGEKSMKLISFGVGIVGAYSVAVCG